MAIPRSSINLGRTVLRRAATQSRTQAWRQAARRHASTDTASAHKAKKTSDIPWIIGSVAFTVPAAVWLLGQGPEKSDHHGASHEAKDEPKEEEESEGQEEEAAPAEESTEEKSEGDSEDKTEDKSEDQSEDQSEDKPEGKSEDKPEDKSEDKPDAKSEEDSSKDEKKDAKADGDDQKSDSSEDSEGKETPDTSGDEDEYEKPGPNAPGQINYKSSMKRGPGENQKGGERAKSETSGEKNSAKDKSGAKNPYLDDDEKSKKGEGLKETQRIHGTVSSDRPLR